MRKFTSALVVLLLLASSSFALLHNSLVKSGERSIAYALLPQLTYSYISSALTYDQSLDENRAFELYLQGERSAFAYAPDHQNQLGVHYRQKMWTLGALRIELLGGLGALYSSTSGTSLSLDAGGVFALPFNDGLKLSLPVVASIFSDGALVDLSLGLDINTLIGQIMLAGKTTMMVLTDPNNMAFSNNLYGLVGIRKAL